VKEMLALGSDFPKTTQAVGDLFWKTSKQGRKSKLGITRKSFIRIEFR
jgi:hypothetical protein